MADKDFKVKSGLDLGTPLPLTEGGTGQTSASNALNALLPVQTDNTSKVLQTNGTSTAWVTLPNGYSKGDTASRPGSPSLGDIHSNTQTGYIEVYTSVGWSQLGVIPESATIGTPTDVGTNVAYSSGSVDVAFTPAPGGGLASSFTAVSTPGSISASGASSPVRVTGLTLGTSYTFTVTSTNGYGNALASSSSSSVTTTSLPQAPTIGSPSVINGTSYGSPASISLAFTAGATGGKTISNYKYSIDNSTYTALSPVDASSPVTIPGLTGGASYTVRLKAVNDNGDSVASSASSSITAITAPNVPTSVSASDVGTSRAYNNGSSTITFSAPADNGGSSITSYTATSSPGGFTGTGASSPVTVAGLQSNTSYTFTVTGTNSSGTSSSSSASSSITATTIPQAPTVGTVTRISDTQVSIPITIENGGKAISSYTITSSPSIALTYSGTSSPISVTGSFTAGTVYTFTVTGTNANGTSTSSVSNSVIPNAVYGSATTYNSSTNYTVGAGKSKIAGFIIGAGGGGGGGVGGMQVGSAPSGYGGSGGATGYQVAFKDVPVIPGTVYAITIGAAGSAGAGGGSYGAGNGGAGGTTSIGSLISITGGGGGPGGNHSLGTIPAASSVGSYTSTIASYIVTSSAGSVGGRGADRGWSASTYSGNAGGTTSAISMTIVGPGTVSSGITAGSGGGGGGGAATYGAARAGGTGGAGGTNGGAGGAGGAMVGGAAGGGGAAINIASAGGGGGGGRNYVNVAPGDGASGGAGYAGRVIIYES